MAFFTFVTTSAPPTATSTAVSNWLFWPVTSFVTPELSSEVVTMGRSGTTFFSIARSVLAVVSELMEMPVTLKELTPAGISFKTGVFPRRF